MTLSQVEVRHSNPKLAARRGDVARGPFSRSPWLFRQSRSYRPPV